MLVVGVAGGWMLVADAAATVGVAGGWMLVADADADATVVVAGGWMLVAVVVVIGVGWLITSNARFSASWVRCVACCGFRG